MEEDVESKDYMAQEETLRTLTGYRHVCSGCLSSDRNLISISANLLIHEIFRFLMYDFAGDRFSDPLADIDHLFCWECVALMKKVMRFKRQVHNAQDQLRILTLSRNQETIDHTYMSQTLSSLVANVKTDYDRIYYDYSEQVWSEQYISIEQDGDGVKNEDFDVAQVVRENIDLDSIEGEILQVPVLESLGDSTAQVMSHIVVTSCDGAFVLPHTVKGEMPTAELTVSPISESKVETVIKQSQRKNPAKVDSKKCGYVTETMTENEMLLYRDSLKEKVQYASSAYKCELCIVGFYAQQQVEDHFVAAHRAKPGLVPCKVCYVYIDANKVDNHVEQHYTRYRCKFCGHLEYSIRLQSLHVRRHAFRELDKGAVNIEPATTQRRNKKQKSDVSKSPPKPGDLRKLLYKTTIEGYKCLECDMFFKNSRARKNHVARFHREGLQCDHCKKRFVNRTTLATHLKLHEGPLPRGECPICHKMVRLIQLKYHIQRHENKTCLACVDCNKVFSHLATYQAHLKYSRAHASEEVFKFPCPMCNKGYPTKEQMQDHFNYQHLGKTVHKCPICDKPIASKANVEKHMMRVHGEKKEKPRNHVCQQCGKAFTDKKALTQHAAIHSGERPLSCDICHQTFKQKASLYTHRKRVHKVFPPKRSVEFMTSVSEEN